MISRIKNAQALLEKNELDGLILSLPANITYLTRYLSRDSYLLISKDKNIYFTDSRYTEEAKEALNSAFSIRQINGLVFNIIANSCIELGLKRIAFEERYLPFAEYNAIKTALQEKAELIPTHNLIEQLRQIKEEDELVKIKKAVQISAQAFKFAEVYIKPGKTELEVAGELERFIRQKGALKSAFDIIVGSGPNSSFPHHISSSRVIRNNEPVLVDMGIDYLGYNSDLTRVFFLGKISVLGRKIYEVALQAQQQAIANIRPGCFSDEIDKIGRNYIKEHKFGPYFAHSLGHGVGLEVHEEPHISKSHHQELKEGMVFTIEPGIYLPHKFGVRIEDMVLVTKKGTEVLSGIIDK